MLEVKRRHRVGRAIGIVLGALAVVGVVVAAVWIYMGITSPLGQKETVVETPKPPQPTTLSSNVLFTGNTFWGRYINDWSMASPLKTAYPFSRLHEFNREEYNAWISGLECPTKSGVNMTSAEMEVALQFNCSPDYLPEAAKWFTAFTLANNHTDNQGEDGFAETRTRLDENGIQYFGHYDPTIVEDVCEVISLPVTVTNDDDSTKDGFMPIALCGYHGVFRVPPKESVEVIEKYSKYMPVIAMPHMGAEYEPAPDQIKTDFYRSLIDAGADMVLGDHPHWIQNTESYKGHLIVYSMGNFMFDQQGVAELVRSAAIRVVMTSTTENDHAVLSKWLELGVTCKTFQDECLMTAETEQLPKLDVLFQLDAIGTNDDKKITKPATPEAQASILERLQWQSTMSQLQLPYSKL